MKTINRTDKGEGLTETSWPRHTVQSIETRKRDVVIRLTDWTRQRASEPGYDVEVYIHGVYDWNESKVFSTLDMPKAEARQKAVEFAAQQFAKFVL